MRILFYTDLHAADQQPRSRTGSYRDDILAKMREIVELANYYKVDYLINGADTFDRKSPWRVSHRLVRELSEIMREFEGGGARHLTCVGTHDVPTGRLEKVDQQPLGMLEEAGVISILGDPREHEVLVAYEGGVHFHFVPASYDLDKDPSNYAFNVDTDDVVITTAHGMIVPPGRTFFGDYTDADTIETKADMVLYGHPHTPDGIYKNKHGTIFVGPGSVCRRDSSSYNRGRIPEVVLIGIDDSESEDRFSFKQIPLKSARPPEEVFSDIIEEEQDENHRNEMVEAFVKNLKDTNIQDDAWGHDQLIQEIRNADVPDPVKRKAEDILDRVGKV